MASNIFIQIIIQIGVYLALMIFIFFALNFWTQGFFAKWLKVKTSRGKLVLVRVQGLTGEYYRPGKISEGDITFKDNKKEIRRLSLPGRESINRGMGVNYVIIDDVKNAVMTIDFKMVSGFDAEKNNSLHIRALYKPSLLDDKTKIIIGVLVVTAILVIVGLVINYQGHKSLMTAIEALRQISSSTGGGVSMIKGG